MISKYWSLLFTFRVDRYMENENVIFGQNQILKKVKNSLPVHFWPMVKIMCNMTDFDKRCFGDCDVQPSVIQYSGQLTTSSKSSPIFYNPLTVHIWHFKSNQIHIKVHIGFKPAPGLLVLLFHFFVVCALRWVIL